MRTQTTLTSWRETVARQNPWRFILTFHALVLLALGTITPTSGWAFDVNNAKLVDKGFKLFTAETFNGNGRTCKTCHLPQHDYGLAPSDLASMSAHDINLVLATKNPNLENPKTVETLTTFNIANGPPGNVNNPEGPLRASMALGGLAFTTSNLCLNTGLISSITADGTTATVTMTESMELFEGETISFENNSIDGFNTTATVTGLLAPTTVSGVLSATQFTFASTTSGVGNGGFVIVAAPCPGAAIGGGVATDGTRDIELGWAGDGAPIDPSIVANSPKNAHCIAAINDFAAHPTDLTRALRAFALGAVRKHFTRSLNRVPGVDFRCPTSAELDAMAAFQEYLGRQIELALCSNSTPSAICTGTQFGANQYATGSNGTQTSYSGSVITFNDAVAETGKAIFMDSRASCNLCHFNSGAQDTIGDDLGVPALAPALVVSPENIATTWQPSQMYVPAIGSPTDMVWGVVMPTDPNNPYLFLAYTSTAGAVGTSGASEPAWPSVIGDTVVDNEITWLNLGIASQRLSKAGRNFITDTNPDALNVLGDPFAAFSGPDGSLPLNELVSPVVIPQDLGAVQGDFNIQSIIEAPRKNSFFHNGAISTNVEDAASFYFSPAFDQSVAGVAHTAPPRGRGCPRGIPCGAFALNSLAATYTGGDTQQVLNQIGFFLRALSTVYSIADCERLVDDSINRIDAGLPIKVPVLNCTTDLSDVDRVIASAHVTVPANYLIVQTQTLNLLAELKKAAHQRNRAKLSTIVGELKDLRHSIASISPDLP